jgi:hypothetical protein
MSASPHERAAAASADVAAARVIVVFTGGTISMTVDPVAGGARPALDGVALLSSTGLAGSVDVVTIDLGRTPASHFSFEDLRATPSRRTPPRQARSSSRARTRWTRRPSRTTSSGRTPGHSSSPVP